MRHNLILTGDINLLGVTDPSRPLACLRCHTDVNQPLSCHLSVTAPRCLCISVYNVGQ
jgi:hypothetical protein